jgi:tetratricopeptide (TPR) repeat protein
MAAAVATLSRFCSTHDALLARIGRQRFACVFAHRTATEGRTLAEALLKALSASQQLSITIGLAAYPTVNYARRQIVENAEKALAHGAFYGPGTVTPFDAVSLNISGDRHYQAGDIDAAVEEFTKGLLIDPTDANLHNSLGVCYGVLKDYAKALTAFESADWLAPDDVMAVYNKGYVRLLQGDREQALACFLEADAREADVFEVVYHIGELYMEMDAPETARAYLEAATRANSRSAAVFRSLGACLDRLGLNKEAIQDYPLVDLVWDADGYGGPGAKIGDYNQYRGEPGFEYGGFKLFYDLDTPLMTPAQVMALEPPPAFVVYQ